MGVPHPLGFGSETYAKVKLYCYRYSEFSCSEQCNSIFCEVMVLGKIIVTVTWTYIKEVYRLKSELSDAWISISLAFFCHILNDGIFQF